MREMLQYPRFPFMVGASLLGETLDAAALFLKIFEAFPSTEPVTEIN